MIKAPNSKLQRNLKFQTPNLARRILLGAWGWEFHWNWKFYRATISAARTVFCNSMAIVIGPTPPGFGVMRPAIG